MALKYRKYEITIEVSQDEQVNLQRFLLEAHRLSITCFQTACLNTLKSEVSLEHRLSDLFRLLNFGSTPR
jgi:hypothetical protein